MRLANRLYTTNVRLNDEADRAAFVKQHLWTIVEGYFPGGLVADRTALEFRPASDGSVFLIAARGGEVELPGITLRPRRGKGPLADDGRWRRDLYLSSTARAYLENMRPSRARSGVARTLSQAEMEEKLDILIRNSGEDGVNAIRDQARRIAPELDLVEESVRLGALIGSLLGTREARLASEGGRARKAGEPFDPRRIALFERLHDVLRARAPTAPRSLKLGYGAGQTQAFFEAYFSNFIEGTEFEVEEAASIVFEGKLPQNRPADAHDVLGTFQIVSDANDMRRRPADADEFVRLLKGRHATIMAARPERLPGQFKEAPNRAGSTSFVHPDDVKGTLRGGFEIYRRLEVPLDRAIFMMFLVSEVHPFADGNGRLARIMMNAELAADDEARIIIPTVFRSNYISGLKALSQNENPVTLIRTLDYAQRYVRTMPWDEYDTALHVLRATNALVRPEEGDEAGIRLRMPTSSDMPAHAGNPGENAEREAEGSSIAGIRR